MLKSFIMAFVVAGVIPATAASIEPPDMPAPQVVPWMDNTTKEVLGTGTVEGQSIYLRNKEGELQATIIIGKDGSRKIYDATGKETKSVPGH